MKVSWTWAVLAVVGCAGGPVGGGEGHPALLISMHIASEEETPGLQPISFEGREIFMEADPFLGDPEIAAVDPVRRGNGVVLHVHLTAEGVEKLRRVTAENVGRPLVLTFGSDVVGVPVIRGQIEGPRVQLSIPAASADQAELIIERVRARWPVQ
jgi:preprotein translocase subunit SecD